MKRVTLSCILRGMAFSALVNVAVPMAEAWAADEVQVLRKSPASVTGVVPFTTFQQEELALTNSVPCKWISKDGRLGPSYGGGRYDFLCKGGDFATVSLYMDKSSVGDGVGGVRMLYRDWPVNSNPNAGEALIAQRFLQHVAGRFIPAAMAGEVMDAFWGTKSRKWSAGGVAIRFEIDKGPQFSVRRLEISGQGSQLNSQLVKMIPVGGGLTKVTPAQTQTKVFVYGKDGEPAQAPERVLPGVAVTKSNEPLPPTDGGLTKPMPIPVQTGTEINVITEPKVVVPVPGAILPAPGVGGGLMGGALIVPKNAPAGTSGEPAKEGELQPASPAELNTAPAPESKVVPVAPPELSSSLVPNTTDIKGVSRRAPSNFDAYNRAMELTKSVEEKAQISKVEEAKVTASKPVTPTLPGQVTSATQIVTPSTEVVPPLKAVPTPGETGQAPAPAVSGEGLGVKTPGGNAVAEPVQPQVQPGMDETGQPANYNGPRTSEPRPLPQLKFVPKAEPLKPANEVLQFEDEKSKL